MRAGGGHLQAAAFRGAHQFTARAAHVGIQLMHVRADFGADLDDGLMHLALHLLAEAGRGCFHQFADVRTQFTRGRIYDLEFFFDTNREPVTHERPLPVGDARTSRGVSYSSWGELPWAEEKSENLTRRRQRRKSKANPRDLTRRTQRSARRERREKLRRDLLRAGGAVIHPCLHRGY